MTDTSSFRSRVLMIPCAAAVMLLSLFLSFRGLSGDTASILFSGICLVLVFLITGLDLVLRPVFRDFDKTLFACGIIYIALCLRLSLFDHISGDYVSFLSGWTDTMRNMTVSEALSTPIGDYNMPYLYMILIVSRLPFYDLYCIKIFSVIFDIVGAVAAMRIAATVQKRESILLIVLAAALFAPTTWLNSAYWGQCDSVYAALALVGLCNGLQKKPVRSLIFFALALSFKLQTIFILPTILFLLRDEYLKFRHLPVFPCAFVITALPALLAGRSFYDTFSIYFSQAEAYPYLTLNAPSVWALFSNDYFDSFYQASIILAGVFVLITIYLALTHRQHFSRYDLITLALIFSLMIPWLLPKMHERYFYLAEMLSAVYWAARPAKRIAVPVILLCGGYLIYCAYLFGSIPILSLSLIAAIYGLLLLWLLIGFFKKSEKPAPVTPDAGETGGLSNGY